LADFLVDCGRDGASSDTSGRRATTGHLPAIVSSDPCAGLGNGMVGFTELPPFGNWKLPQRSLIPRASAAWTSYDAASPLSVSGHSYAGLEDSPNRAIAAGDSNCGAAGGGGRCQVSGVRCQVRNRENASDAWVRRNPRDFA